MLLLLLLLLSITSKVLYLRLTVFAEQWQQ